MSVSNFDGSPGVRGAGQKMSASPLDRPEFAQRLRFRHIRELAHRFWRNPSAVLEAFLGAASRQTNNVRLGCDV